MKIYEIVRDEDDFDDENNLQQGPFTFEEIEDLVERRFISRDQEIRNLETSDRHSADYVLIFERAEEESEEDMTKGKSSKLKAVVGALILIAALSFLALIIHGANSGQRVRGRQLIIIGVMGLAGAKILIDNVGKRGRKK